MDECQLLMSLRRTNLVVQIANGMVCMRMLYAQVHPKVVEDGPDRGRFPRSFERPLTMEHFLAMESELFPPLLFFPSPSRPSHIHQVVSSLYQQQ